MFYKLIFSDKIEFILETSLFLFIVIIVLSDCHTRSVVKLDGVIVSVVVLIAVMPCVIIFNDHGAQWR
jgi:hypothetical protein